ncbi:hypothetical protein M409DRAFT_60314 [Zasmidium cellare ATCC 36951]|uniref:Uncharacterized protein n=1 Tax=Zasmidium cellare ATCC 36951 TaxID=1080233 RepID=A0A6A6BZ48_ZASCE|nr:uncharacterized protein M409DRAFT_60314 [Zasmidium cellare ATCC 36951]KAF2160061.1 hypothetical protein M409DRAFT_60314 [Zasmidium cellare ATCC 36951]
MPSTTPSTCCIAADAIPTDAIPTDAIPTDAIPTRSGSFCGSMDGTVRSCAAWDDTMISDNCLGCTRRVQAAGLRVTMVDGAVESRAAGRGGGRCFSEWRWWRVLNGEGGGGHRVSKGDVAEVAGLQMEMVEQVAGLQMGMVEAGAGLRVPMVESAAGWAARRVSWLVLPVVIRLSRRSRHAGLGMGMVKESAGLQMGIVEAACLPMVMVVEQLNEATVPAAAAAELRLKLLVYEWWIWRRVSLKSMARSSRLSVEDVLPSHCWIRRRSHHVGARGDRGWYERWGSGPGTWQPVGAGFAAGRGAKGKSGRMSRRERHRGGRLDARVLRREDGEDEGEAVDGERFGWGAGGRVRRTGADAPELNRAGSISREIWLRCGKY